MSILPEVFFSCDWGTSNFRLRLVRTENLDVLDEFVSDRGIAVMNRRFEAQTELPRPGYFSAYLSLQVEKLQPETGENRSAVIVSGMASSTIGLQELPYTPAPFDATGRDLVTERLQLSPRTEVILVSGVRCADDVMRGEETQAVGLAALLDMEQPGLLVLPGTHSKHIRFSAGKFTGFRTYMTGELFRLLGENSVLAPSIRESSSATDTAGGFTEGVRQGIDGQLAANLFTIRSADLLGSRSKQENVRFLSGLLIGSELANLRQANIPVWIAAPVPLNRLYRTAIEHALPEAQVCFIDSHDLEKALLTGHRNILRSAATG